jgi:hypothetical protein
MTLFSRGANPFLEFLFIILVIARRKRCTHIVEANILICCYYIDAKSMQGSKII